MIVWHVLVEITRPLIAYEVQHWHTTFARVLRLVIPHRSFSPNAPTLRNENKWCVDVTVVIDFSISIKNKFSEKPINVGCNNTMIHLVFNSNVSYDAFCLVFFRSAIYSFDVFFPSSRFFSWTKQTFSRRKSSNPADTWGITFLVTKVELTFCSKCKFLISNVCTIISACSVFCKPDPGSLRSGLLRCWCHCNLVCVLVPFKLCHFCAMQGRIHVHV